MKRIVIKVAYLGDGFSGSQAQPGKRTVESQVEDDISKVCHISSDEMCLRFSSRTDKGVNALGNTLSFYTPMDDGQTLLRALNAVSCGVYYRSFCFVDDGFNIRHASSRSYRYILPSKGMDLDIARACASLFIGEHDFARFCKYDGKPTVANIDSIEVIRNGDTVALEFHARFFLWNMIRRISSAIHRTSLGRASLEAVEAALNGEDISFGMSRPDALTLLDVDYDWLHFEDARGKTYHEKTDELVFSGRVRQAFLESL
jgi:tRNA pseudouridine38-40 synthase